MPANFYFNRPVHTSLELITPPAIEPVTLDQAKAQARVEISDDDDLISSLITAARVQCEAYLRQSFITTTWQFNLDAFPFWRTWSVIGPPIVLPKPPVQTVAWVKYLDNGGNSTTVDPSLYTVDTASRPARIVRDFIQPWPVIGFVPNAAQVQYTSGYGDTADDVPAPIKQAILLLVTYLYAQRGDTEGLAQPPMAVTALLDSCSHGGF